MNHLGTSLLLKPARDLERNWDIDVASELESYLTHVEEQVHRFKEGGITGGKTHEADEDPAFHINFIEAALMLQSGTSVYSKKVEYLLALTYKTWNNFNESGKTTEHNQPTLSRRGGRSAGKKGSRFADDWDVMDAFFVPWNVIPKDKMNHRFSSLEKDKVGKTPYDSIYCQSDATNLSVTEIKKKYFDIQHLENSSQTRIEQINLLLVPRDDRDELRITSLIPHPISGALLVDPQDALRRKNYTFSQTYLRDGCYSVESISAMRSVNRTPFAQSQSFSSHQQDTPALLSGFQPPVSDRRSEAFHAHEKTPSAHVPQQPWAAANLPTYMTNTHPGSSHYDNLTTTTGISTSNSFFSQKSRLNKNPLERLNCHQTLGRSKVQQIGNTTRKPDSSIYLASADSLPYERFFIFSQLQRCSFVASRWIHSLSSESSPLQSCPKTIPTFPDLKSPTSTLSDTYLLGPTWSFLESEWGAASKKAASIRLSDLRNLPNEKNHSAFDKEPMEDSFNDAQNHETLDILNVELSEKDAERNTDQYTDIAYGSDANASHVSETEIELAVEKSRNSYGKVLDNGVDSDAHPVFYENSTAEEPSGMRQRVSVWRSLVERWLNFVNKSSWFDVGLYKENFSRKLVTQMEGGEEKKISFRTLVNGCQRSDVCRYFLITLLLCNEQHISIESNHLSDTNFFITLGESEQLQFLPNNGNKKPDEAKETVKMDSGAVPQLVVRKKHRKNK